MSRKWSMTIISAVLTVIVFVGTTALQKALVDYRVMVDVVVANKDILPNRQLGAYMFKTAKVPLDLVANLKVVKTPEAVVNHYSVEPIHNGEVLLQDAIALKGEVKNMEVSSGKEKISVRLKSSENSISYQVRTGDVVRLYFTGKYDAVKNLDQKKEIYLSGEQLQGQEGYCTVELLDNVIVQGVFDSRGNPLGEYDRKEKVDTIVFSVSHEDALVINNCKDQGSFDVTGLPYQ